jgi:hypothetical protein
MPRWYRFCKEGEEPCKTIDTHQFGEVFNIKSGFGPPVLDKDSKEVLDCDLRPKMKWNRCWSHIPEEWESAIQSLLHNIRSKYRTEGVDDDEDDPEIEVFVDQIKDKFGTLCFYYQTQGSRAEEIRTDIDDMVRECIQEIKKADPYYGEPY